MFAIGVRGLSGRSFRLLAAVLPVIVVATLVGEPPAFAKPGKPPVGLRSQQDAPIPGVRLATKPRPSDPAQAAAARTAARPAPVWPTPSTVDVALPPARAQSLSSIGPVRAGTLPVWIEHAAADADTSARVRVRMLDRAVAKAAGVDGLLLQLDTPDGAGDGGDLRVSVDYTGFAGAYGADWAARLRLVSVPACALSTPAAAGCATGTSLPSTNRAGKVTATVRLAAHRPDRFARTRSAAAADGAASAVLALTADASSSAGDYGATPLTASATWSVDGNSGNFAWSYPVRVPPSLGGAAPAIGVSYSSQSVDGSTASSNNQPGWLGQGFAWWPGYIERRYKPCADDMDTAGHNNAVKTGDRCWETDNASLSLSGHSGELLKDPDDSRRWHLRTDDGSLVMHETGAGNGDNDGEWWRVTTSDGTQYWFGGAASANSTWNMPVFGNDPDEPCHQTTYVASGCTQAWRWNLDFVVDPHGNTTSYHYLRETNKYGRNNSSTDVAAYDRGGYLDTISYGTRAGDTGPAPMQVTFDVADRCLSSCATHGANWPDVPWEQECTSAPCVHTTPTFWTTKRLAAITTKVWNPSASGYRDVERWTFTHSFPDPGDGTRAGLWLSRISHTGLVGTATTVPDVVFSGVQLQNRVDTIADQLFPMNWWRVSRIDTEVGGAVIVKYAQPECVPGTAAMPNPDALQDNTLRCYPVRWTPDGYPKPITDYFHKYVVAELREADLTGGAPDVVHTYEYVGGGAWHYSDDDGLVQAENKTWSVWRGYGTVRQRTADAATATQTYSQTQYFRGMHGDHLPNGTRTVTLPAVDVDANGRTTDAADAPAATDEDAFAGVVRGQTTYNGVNGPEVSATVNEPWQSAPTTTRTINGTTVFARYTDTARVHTRSSLDTDGGTRPAGMRTTSKATTFDAYGMATEVEDRGDDAVSGDEKCSLTTYARATDAAHSVWITSPARRVQTFAVGCAAAKAGGLGDGDVIGDVRMLFDHLGYGATPTKAEVTEVQEMKAYNAGSPAYVTVFKYDYDAYGRVTHAWDVDNNHTGTAYTPASGGPLAQVETTNPVGWKTTTTVEPAWGKLTAVVDTNNRRTDAAFDGLGRTTAVWQPGQDKAGGQGATATYSYLLRTNGANAVTTRTLNPAGGYTTSVALFDGLLRPRQTQTPDASVSGARIVTDTFYDSAGRAWKATSPYTMTGAPATDVYIPRPPDYSGPEALPAWTVNLFDGAGRVTDSVFYTRGNVEKWRTKTAYTGDRVDTTPPDGGTATSAVTDAAGNTVALRQYHGATPTGAHDTTTYTYNRKGQLRQVADAAGNHWDFQFDLRGRQVQIDDPDHGRTTSTYDDAGRVLTTTDALNRTLGYTYDSLGRKSTVRDGSVTGPKRAEWTYDTVVKGKPTKAIRYDSDGNAYTFEIQSYSARYQPGIVKYTLPLTETGFGATSFSYTNNYNPDGSAASTRIPVAGGLTLETLTYGYTGLGQPATVSTNLGGTLVTATGYTNYGEPNIVTLQNNAGKIAQIGQYYEDGTRRLKEIKTTSAAAPTTTYADAFYTYDPAGNITRISEAVAGDHQCLDYDHLRRLTEAWTPASGDCLAAPSAAGLGGPAPYWTTWTIDAVGNRLSQTDHTGATTAAYAYPPAGGPRPHTVTGVTYTGGIARTDAYGYDAAGHTVSRPGGTSGQTLTWDAEEHLASQTDSTGTTSFLYDAGGERLIRKDPAGKTLYLPGQEIRYTNATGVATATRYYSYGGKTVATRAPSGLTWLAGDHQGTTSVAITATTQATAIRRTTPYGDIRATTGTWPASFDKGLLGGTKDNTGLIHLGAREYDGAIGRFISVDPLFDLADPQSWQGYAYANSTPVTASDPSGLRIAGCEEDHANCRTGAPLPDTAPGNGGPGAPEVKFETPHMVAVHDPKTGKNYINNVEMPAEMNFQDTLLKLAILLGDESQRIWWPSWGLDDPYYSEEQVLAVLMHICGVDDCGKGVGQTLLMMHSGHIPIGWGDGSIGGDVATGAKGIAKGVAPKLFGTGPHGPVEIPADVRAAMCHSFDPDTPVLMADGTSKPIKDIKVEDEVLATDPVSGQTLGRAVTALHNNRDTDLTDVTVSDGEHRITTLHTTEHHPFWDETARSWVEASDLQPGHRLHSVDGRPVLINAVRNFTAVRAMNDLTVATTHTYYVLAGRTPVLVHNTQACGPEEIANAWHPGTYDSAQTSFAEHYARHNGGMTQQEYLDAAKSFAAQVTTPGGSRGMTVKRVPIGFEGDGYGVKYTDSAGQMVIIAPDGKIVVYDAGGSR